MEKLKARDFMTAHPAKVTAGMNIINALRIILDRKQSAAAVVDDDGKLIGILSEADCIKGAMAGGFHEHISTTVNDRMSTEVQTVSAETTLLEAADLFLKHHRRVLPVIDNGKLIGTLSRENILHALLHELDNPTPHVRIA